MKTIRLLKDVIGGNGEPLEEGSLHSLNEASANHWLKRGLAVEVDQAETEEPVEERVEETAADVAPRHRKQNKG